MCMVYFILLHEDIQFSQHNFLRGYHFPIVCSWCPHWKSVCVGFSWSLYCFQFVYLSFFMPVPCWVFVGGGGFYIYLFIYLACWVFIVVHGLSLVAASGGYSSFQCTGFSLWWLLLLQSMGSRCVGFSSCSMWVQWLWHTGSVVVAHRV